MSRLLLRDVEVEGRCVDVRIAAGTVTDVGPRLPSHRKEDSIDGRGGALLPGLVDHHLHLLALAARITSVDASGVTDRAELAALLASAPRDEGGWVRVVGYDEQVCGWLDRHALDGLGTPRVRVQEQSGALWIVDSVGAADLGLLDAASPAVERQPDGTSTGRIWRGDVELRARLGPAALPPLDAVGRELARYGLTAVTDATPDLDDVALRALADARRDGVLPQRVTVLGAANAPSGLAVGPQKLVLGDHDLPDLPTLSALLAPSRAQGRPVAVHCVTAVALVLLLTALEDVGRLPGDRVEHAAVVPLELVSALRGLRVVTQPGFLLARGGRFRRGTPPEEWEDLYRHASLLTAGVSVAASSDAPHGLLDPWTVMRAARDRIADDGAVLGPAERVPAATALRGYLSPTDDPGGRPRAVAPGAAADLVLLEAALHEILAEPDADRVRLTIVDGRPVSG